MLQGILRDFAMESPLYDSDMPFLAQIQNHSKSSPKKRPTKRRKDTAKSESNMLKPLVQKVTILNYGCTIKPFG